MGSLTTSRPCQLYMHPTIVRTDHMIDDSYHRIPHWARTTSYQLVTPIFQGIGVIMIKAIAYYRTSSAANVGDDKDSLTRQRVAVERFAKQAGYTIAEEFYDAAVSGADALDARPGFTEALRIIAANGVRTIICETASRFARDLIVAETGYRRLREAGITLIAADSPNSFLDDTPTS